jgi:hypothetical protein
VKKTLGLIIGGIFVCLGFLAFSPWQKAEAHVYESDGEISAYLHLAPAHIVIVGSSSQATLEFSDSSNRLNIKQCDCTVIISFNGSSTYSGKVGVDPNLHYSETEIDFYYTYPKEGRYIMTIIGKPINGISFQSFKMDFPFPVLPADTKLTAADFAPDEEESTDHAGHSLAQHLAAGHYLHIALFGVAFLIVGYIVIRDKRRQKV